MDYLKHKNNKPLLHILSLPFLWLPLPCLLVCDLVCTLYELICFPIYGIEWVKRSEYILVMDRNKLNYLQGVQKLGCMYCGYANGILRYMKEVSGRTEKYWCGLMHEGVPGFKKQEDQAKQDFAKFGDKKDFEGKYGKIEKS